MGEDVDAANKGWSAVRQAVAALVLVPGMALGLWWVAQQDEGTAGSGPPAASCDHADEAKGPGQVSGRDLCEALHRPGLAALLGIPGRTAKSATGSGGSVGKDFTPSGEVEFEGYTVSLAATYGGPAVAGSAELLGDTGPKRTVLGRPAALYSSQALQIRFRLDGSDAHSGPSIPARVLTVAREPKDDGDSYELSIWRTDGGLLDDEALLRVAGTVLPALPGWSPAR
ncbi:DUF6215 domain-containing protein [Streptomyces sp. NPDC089919]|uniref:DUF6215 domain-containing protein n=1 Tax=Streptomyces sp. NPDC089919 TaxID=3155188 RepID=UPI0034282E1B